MKKICGDCMNWWGECKCVECDACGQASDRECRICNVALCQSHQIEHGEHAYCADHAPAIARQEAA